MGKMLELDRRDLASALIIVVVGILIFVWSIISGLSGLDKELIQVTAPGTVDLELQEVGDYTIFYETVSFIGDRFYSTGETFPSGLEIEVVDISSGEDVALRSPMGSSTYDIDGRSGRSIAAFTIGHSGVYRMRTWYSPGRKGPEVVLAVGHDFFGKTISVLWIPLAAFFGSIIVARWILTSGWRKRQREEERLREENRLIRGR